MTQEFELLKKLYTFYQKRYKNKSTMEEKFNDSIVDLIQTGDIQKASYYEFCVDNDIEPRSDRVRPQAQQPPNNANYYNDGCAGGNRGYNNGC